MRRKIFLALVVVLACAGGFIAGRLLRTDPADAVVAVVPEEPADPAALGLLGDWSGLPILRRGRYRQQSSEDRDTGRAVPIELWANGNKDMNNFVCAGDSAEGPRDDPAFVLDLERCPEPYVEGFVMARFEGSGRLARLWLTASSLRRARQGPSEVLRIYVDDGPAPVIRVSLGELLDGRAGEIFAAPFGAGSGRYLAWYYPVVFGQKLIVTLDRLGPRDLYFHQTAVVLDDPPVPRRAARARLPARDQVIGRLRSLPPSSGAAPSQKKPITLAAQQSATVLDVAGPATIVSTRLRLAQAHLSRLDGALLTLRWDGQEPAAAIPLSYLFVTGETAPTVASPALGAETDGAEVVLRLSLPMPFAERAEWTLTNTSAEELRAELTVELSSTVPAGRWGHLRVQHHETTAERRRAWHPLVAAAQGPGRLVGVCLMMRGHALAMTRMRGHVFNFLEGDEVGLIDGERALGGTGTEDYFNGAFYFEDGPTATPFAQVWGIDQQVPGAPRQGRVSTCRWHVLGDAIDFAASLQLDMEVGPGAPQVLDRYRSVAFLYQEARPG